MSIPVFKKHLEESILDPEGVHHEFVSGLHGRKLDFDTISDDDPLFDEWVAIVAEKVKELYPDVPKNKLVLLSVAGGTNRLVGPVAQAIGHGVTPVLTEKVSVKEVKLTDEAARIIKSRQPELVLAIEDVGTSGSTSATAVLAARRIGAGRVEALNTWQRRKRLEKLEAINTIYNSIIKDMLPTLEPAECQKDGYCAKGWKFIPHD